MRYQVKIRLRLGASELRKLAKLANPNYERNRTLCFIAAGVGVGALLVALYLLLLP